MLEQALPHFNAALSTDPAFCSAAVHKGLAQASLGDREGALQSFLKVIEASDGGCPLSHAYVAPLRLLHGFNMDVMSHCERALELDPTLLEAYNCLSTVLMVKREYQAAAKVLESITFAGAGEADDVIKLAYAYQNSCNWKFFRRTKQRVVQQLRIRLLAKARIASQASWVAELLPMSPSECLQIYHLKATAVASSVAHLPQKPCAAAFDRRIFRI